MRILLVLLLAVLATPVAAAEPACHGGSGAMSMPMMHQGSTDAPLKATPPHACAGCVPLADWLAERIAAPLLPVAVSPVARIARLDPASGTPPALPPPRHG